MNDRPSSRLEMLRFLARVQAADLERTRRWIADEERRQAERRTGEERRPPTPDWVIELGLNREAPVGVHVGDCRMRGKRWKPVSGEVALRALAEGVPACSHCRPDADLGFLDG